MAMEAVQHPARQPARAPPRLRPKAPLQPDLYRQVLTAAGRPKQSAVERLEADKAKYVKSQVALGKQLPLRPPEGRKPLVNSGDALRPTRKPTTLTKTEGVQLDLEHLTNLISDVSDGPQSSAAADSEDGGPDRTPTPGGAPAGLQQKKERPRPPPRPNWSSPAKVRLKAFGPARPEGAGAPGAPAAGAVRRVDVVPQARPARPPCRPPLYIRQPLHPLHLQFRLRQAASHMHLFQPRTPAGPLKPDNPPPSPAGAPVLAAFAPPSPARTRLSTSSSRKRPSLTRSKSDMSDRCSRAGTELERFFNLCGLDPADLQEWAGSSSDILSMARFRSVSAPGSECREDPEGAEEEEEEEEGAGTPAGRAPYGVSVIERNARVIKWLYGLRSAKDNGGQSTNL